jgi:hypothetical protein
MKGGTGEAGSDPLAVRTVGMRGDATGKERNEESGAERSPLGEAARSVDGMLPLGSGMRAPHNHDLVGHSSAPVEEREGTDW